MPSKSGLPNGREDGGKTGGKRVKMGNVCVGAQADLKALYTCTSWYAYAAMFGSSMRSLV